MMGKVLFMRKGETHTAPSAGILASDLAVGSSVYLMENGSAAEYLVVNQGIPSNSSLYDSSCDGTWLLRKDCYTEMIWGNSYNDYSTSSATTYLNSTYFNLLGVNEQAVIKTVKIPYRSGAGNSDAPIMSGVNGLEVRAFLLSAVEIGNSNTSAHPTEGGLLDYFIGDFTTESYNQCIAKYDGTAIEWWTRTPYRMTPRYEEDTDYMYTVSTVGVNGLNGLRKANWSTYGIRPALILPSNALFDTETLILKGVS